MTNKQKIPVCRSARRRVTFWIETAVMDQIQSEAKERSISQRNILETTLKERYSPEKREDREALLARRLNRIDSRLKVNERQSEIIAESLALYVRMWLASTHELPDEQKDAAALQGQVRYDRYISSLAKRIQGGDTILGIMPKELSLTPNNFVNKLEDL